MSDTQVHSEAAIARIFDMKLKVAAISVSDIDRDRHWPNRYADYMVREQADEELPT